MAPVTLFTAPPSLGGHLCRLTLDGHPLTGTTFGVAGTITPLVDLWTDEGRLPSYMRASPKAGR